MIKEVKTTEQMMKLIRINIKDKRAISELLCIGEVVFQSRAEDHANSSKHDQHYY